MAFFIRDNIYRMIVKKERKSHAEVAHNFRNRYTDETQLAKPSEEATKALQIETRKKMDEILGLKTSAAFGTNIQKLGTTESEMVKFTSKGETGESNKQRIARIDTVQIDPLMPPLHKHRKLPRGPGSPPPQLLRSPPRKVTKKDMEDWKVPPCISNWKNSKGYTIPIHMRLGADGRSLQHNTINEHFADIIDSLYIAERQSKLQLQDRLRIQKSVDYKEYLKKQEALREAAMQAREEGRKIYEEQEEEEEDDDYEVRQKFREHRARELEREERMKKVGAEKKKQIRREERDISEKVALGQAQPSNQDLQFDQRLYDNADGLEAGNSDSEGDNLYDKPLFTDRQQLYSGLVSSDGKQKGRTEPVKFEKHNESVFGMDGLLGKPQKKAKKQ